MNLTAIKIPAAQTQVEVLLRLCFPRPDLLTGYLKGLNSILTGEGVVWALNPWVQLKFYTKISFTLVTNRPGDWHTLLSEQQEYHPIGNDVYRRDIEDQIAYVRIQATDSDNPFNTLAGKGTTLDMVGFNGDEVFGPLLVDGIRQGRAAIVDHTKVTNDFLQMWTNRGFRFHSPS
jgi:hypothetical protein